MDDIKVSGTRRTIKTTTAAIPPERLRQLVGAPANARVFVEALGRMDYCAGAALELDEDVSGVVVSWQEETIEQL